LIKLFLKSKNNSFSEFNRWNRCRKGQRQHSHFGTGWISGPKFTFLNYVPAANPWIARLACTHSPPRRSRTASRRRLSLRPFCPGGPPTRLTLSPRPSLERPGDRPPSMSRLGTFDVGEHRRVHVNNVPGLPDHVFTAPLCVLLLFFVRLPGKQRSWYSGSHSGHGVGSYPPSPSQNRRR
jgi:hypothetical protein